MFLKGSLQHFEVAVKTTSGFTDSSLFFFFCLAQSALFFSVCGHISVA